MSIEVPTIGDDFHVAAEFLDEDDNPTDPTTITLKVLDPSGNVDTYTFGQSPGGVDRDSQGNYSVDIAVNEAGDWHYEWISTGAAKGGEPGQFVVPPSHFS